MFNLQKSLLINKTGNQLEIINNTNLNKNTDLNHLNESDSIIGVLTYNINKSEEINSKLKNILINKLFNTEGKNNSELLIELLIHKLFKLLGIYLKGPEDLISEEYISNHSFVLSILKDLSTEYYVQLIFSKDEYNSDNDDSLISFENDKIIPINLNEESNLISPVYELWYIWTNDLSVDESMSDTDNESEDEKMYDTEIESEDNNIWISSPEYIDLTNLELDEEDQEDEDFIERSKIVKDKFLPQSKNIFNNSIDVSSIRRIDVIIRAIK